MITSIEELQARTTAVSLDEIDHSLFTQAQDAFQPPETTELRFLKEKFYTNLAQVMEKDIAKPDEKAEVDEKLRLLTFVYGGENRFYERFYFARGKHVEKAAKQMRNMLELRKKILGPKMVTSITMTRDLNDLGEPGEERKLFEEIEKYWAIEFYGFTKDRYVLMTAKLRDIKPSDFMKKYKKEEIQRYYFHFVEKANYLIRLSNSAPFSKGLDTDNRSKRMFEVYDFKGITRKQLQISGLLFLKDVLKVGQVAFPEQVHKTRFINAPWFLSAAWSVVSVSFDKNAKQKTKITRGDCKKEIVEVLGSEDLLDSLFDRVERKIAPVRTSAASGIFGKEENAMPVAEILKPDADNSTKKV